MSPNPERSPGNRQERSPELPEVFVAFATETVDKMKKEFQRVAENKKDNPSIEEALHKVQQIVEELYQEFRDKCFQYADAHGMDPDGLKQKILRSFQRAFQNDHDIMTGIREFFPLVKDPNTKNMLEMFYGDLDGVAEASDGELPEENDRPSQVTSRANAKRQAAEAALLAGEATQSAFDQLGSGDDGQKWQESAEKLAKSSFALMGLFDGVKGPAPAPSQEELSERTEQIAGFMLMVKGVMDVLKEFKKILGDFTGEVTNTLLQNGELPAEQVQNPKAEAAKLTGSEADIVPLENKTKELNETIGKTTDAATLASLKTELQTTQTKLNDAKRKVALETEHKNREALVKGDWEKAGKESKRPKEERGIKNVALGGDGNDLEITLRDDTGIASLPEFQEALKKENIRMEGSTIKVQLGTQWKAEISKVLSRLAGMNLKGEMLAEK